MQKQYYPIANQDHLVVSTLVIKQSYIEIRFGEIFGQNGARQNCGSVASPTRMIIGGGGFPNVLSGMDFITIPTEGDSQDFGDLAVASRSQSGVHNSTRGIFTGGFTPATTNTAPSASAGV